MGRKPKNDGNAPKANVEVPYHVLLMLSEAGIELPIARKVATSIALTREEFPPRQYGGWLKRDYPLVPVLDESIASIDERLAIPPSVEAIACFYEDKQKGGDKKGKCVELFVSADSLSRAEKQLTAAGFSPQRTKRTTLEKVLVAYDKRELHYVDIPRGITGIGDPRNYGTVTLYNAVNCVIIAMRRISGSSRYDVPETQLDRFKATLEQQPIKPLRINNDLWYTAPQALIVRELLRSEERRVGKECRL